VKTPSQLRETDTTTLTWDQLRMALEILDEQDRILLELDMTDALRSVAPCPHPNNNGRISASHPGGCREDGGFDPRRASQAQCSSRADCQDRSKTPREKATLFIAEESIIGAKSEKSDSEEDRLSA